MKRRKFIQNSSFAAIALGGMPGLFLNKIFMPGTENAFVVDLAPTLTQIRHGALNFQTAKALNEVLPFEWLLNVHSNVFFQNGFQSNPDSDLNIVSIALKKANAEGIHALQLSIEQEQLTLMWKDAFVKIPNQSGFHAIEIPEQNESDAYHFYQGNFSKNNSERLDLVAEQSYFIKVLEGEIKINGEVLNSQKGLGIEVNGSVDLSALEDSRIFVIASNA